MFVNWLPLVLLLMLALGLRLRQYWIFPIGGETADESAWAMFGASLLQTGQPTSWSYFAPYQSKYVYSQRQGEAPLVRPVLDHPPLFALIPGSAHLLVKKDWQVFPSIKVVRLPLVLLGTFNVGLFWLLARRLFGAKKWAGVATLIYAVGPTFVFASRLVVAENLVVTWTILALLLLTYRRWRYQFWALILVSVLAVMTKMSGLVVPASIFIYGLASKDRRVAWAGLGGGILGVLSLIAYGAYFNWSLFVAVFKSQASRELGWTTLQNRFFIHADIVEKIFFDGWIFLGLFASAVLLFRNLAKFKAINIFFVVGLFFILLTSGERTFHGWYDYALYPLLLVAIGSLVEDIFAHQNWLMFAFVWLMLLPVLRMTAIHLNVYRELPGILVRGVAMAGFLPFFLSQFKFLPVKKWRWLAWLMLGLLLLAGMILILNFRQEAYWVEHDYYRAW